MLQLFPVVKEKGLGLELSYQDDMIGTIKIEGDLDLHTCLQSFTEEQKNNSQLENLTLHATECVKPLAIGTLKKRNGKAISNTKSKKAKLVINMPMCSLFGVKCALLNLSMQQQMTVAERVKNMLCRVPHVQSQRERKYVWICLM